MPNKDWYWDRFDVDVKQGQLDLSDEQTSAIQDNEKFTDQQATNYETRFIDELYGTDDRAWAGEDGPRDDGRWYHHSRGAAIGFMGEGAGKGGKGAHDNAVTWGLDLVRDWTDWDYKKNPVGSDEHYEHQTRGQVDWAHYYDDNAYQKAFREYKSENRDIKHSNLESYLTTDQGRFKTFDQQRVDFINWADTEYQASESDKGKESLRTTWDNKYIDQFDPEKAEPYTPTYLDVPDLWAQAEAKSDWEIPLTPMEVVRPPTIPNLQDIQRLQVKDTNTKWLGVREAPTHKFTAGGQPSGGGSLPPITTQGGKD